MVNAKPICILHFIHPVKWKKSKRSSKNLSHSDVSKKNLPQGNETCTCLQKFRIDSERNVKFNHLYFKFDCSNFQVFLHTMYFFQDRFFMYHYQYIKVNIHQRYLHPQQVQVLPSLVTDCKKPLHRNRLIWGPGIGNF